MKRYLTILGVATLLAACSDSNTLQVPPATEAPEVEPPAPGATFEVTTTNLTAGQPLSPIALIAHTDTLRVFTIGEAASVGLELLAEGGDNSGLLDEFDGRGEVSGEAPVGPGASETLTLELDSDDTAATVLSVITMLVNTNDAITGFTGMDLASLAVGDSVTVDAVAYDAGTEANSEAAGTIPGPADSGEGFNETRDDLGDQVTMHPGVVTAADGLDGSVLMQIHRFDNPVARITVTRIQ